MTSDANRNRRKSYSARFAAWLALFNFIDLLSIIIPARPSAKSKKRVVFVKMDGIGDYVIWTATFDSLEKIYPSAEYERILVGSSKWKDLAENAGIFDQKIFIDSDKFVYSLVYRFKMTRKIRNLDADVVVNPRLTREFLWSDSVVRCSGAPVRIGSRGLDNLMTRLQERISERWYTRLIAAPKREDHELVSNLKFLKALDPDIEPDLQIPGGAENPSPQDLGVSGDYAVFFVGAFTSDRRWPIANFAETAEFVSRKYGFGIVLCGGPGDEGLANGFASGFSGGFVNLIGKTKLQDLGHIIGSARMVVTNDTGAGHIAIASRCPTVVITPGNQVGRFFPYPPELEKAGLRHFAVLHEMPCFGCGWNCIYTDMDKNSPKPCIANISVHDVTGAVATLLDNKA